MRAPTSCRETVITLCKMSQICWALLTPPAPIGTYRNAEIAFSGIFITIHFILDFLVLVVDSFLMPVVECELALTSILEELSRDPWPTKADERMACCTGVALSTAVNLLEVMIAHDSLVVSHNIELLTLFFLSFRFLLFVSSVCFPTLFVASGHCQKPSRSNHVIHRRSSHPRPWQGC